MRHLLFLIVLIGILIAATVGAQKSKVDAPASPQSILYLVADTQRELTRLPAKFSRMSDADEIAAGDAIVAAFPMQESKPGADDAAVEAYVQDVGRRVAAHANRKLPYRFHYIADPDFVNAFAVPGGHVFIGAGLLNRMNSEDELAAVLAHEIEHIDHYHCAERLQLERALRKVSAPVLALPITLFQTGYTKAEETEADGEAIHLAARAGYSANGIVHVLETYDRLYRFVAKADRTPQDELTRVAMDALIGYFASHPPTAERIARAKAMISRDPSLASGPERRLEIQHVVLARRAAGLIAKEKYDEAASLSAQSLLTKSDYARALVTLTEANFGRRSLASAQSAYRALIELDAKSAAAVETWLLGLAEHQIEHGHPHEAAIELQAFLDVQANDPKALRTLTLARALDGDTVDAVASATVLHRLYPQIAAEAEKELQPKAKALLDSKDFVHAAALGRACVALQPGSIGSLRTLAYAEFSQANFAEAAQSYEQALAIEPGDVVLFTAFAESAAAANPTTAAHDVEKVVPRLKVADAVIKTELAGLNVLAANDAPARDVTAAVQNGVIAPELLARIGWWYFRANRISNSKGVLDEALHLRPANPEAQNNFAWAELAANSADIEPVATPPDSIVRSSSAARHAIAMWHRGKKEAAVDAWRQVIREDPQWSNEKWRNAIYPAAIAESAKQIDVERMRLDAAQEARFNAWLAARKAIARNGHAR